MASGMGEPSLRAAQRVGPSGFVLGTDLVDGMLEVARETARAQGLSNIEFRAADAETLALPEQSFEVATVRWGLMYMPRPERALERIGDRQGLIRELAQLAEVSDAVIRGLVKVGGIEAVDLRRRVLLAFEISDYFWVTR